MRSPAADPACRLHRFASDASLAAPPRQFTNPFCYAPHPLCLAAAREVQEWLASEVSLTADLAHEGKMFGVLVVRDGDGRLGFLAAFSGLLGGTNDLPYFVPPVFDLLRPGEWFRTEEAGISALNRRIADLEQAYSASGLARQLALRSAQAEARIESLKQHIRQHKAERDLRRQRPLSPNEAETLVRQSQHEKAELRRVRQAEAEALAALAAEADRYVQPLDAWKAERRRRSADLQEWLFHQFRFRNARGAAADLPALFEAADQGTPPAGAGECAAPKLLQHAYLHRLTPLCMAEFWWGAPRADGLRRPGRFYPACTGKCRPILGFMLQGLDVEPDPSAAPRPEDEGLRVVYEDEQIVVVEKPAGLLSVPGRDEADSVLTRLRRLRPDAEGPLLVHRLDMATSGLLLAAKDKATHRALQAQFEARTVRKRYSAWLSGPVGPDEGTLSLPLGPDWHHRPCQRVDLEQGKPALTLFRVERREAGLTLVSFFPQTGRTHQLRVHAASALGLDAPIVGDALYGRPADRLYLHAASLAFTHPATGQEVGIECEAAWARPDAEPPHCAR